MKKISDQNIRDQALNMGQSFIVQAPAGSGKTTLLIQRMLTSLTTVNKPEHVMALTFTKKAANEMQERIIAALHCVSEDSEFSSSTAETYHHDLITSSQQNPSMLKTRSLAKAVLIRSQECGWEILENPQRLQIQTLDALSAQITQQLPLISGLGGPVSITDNPIVQYEEAARLLCLQLDQAVPWQAALARLLAHLDNRMDKLEALLIQMLGNREQWLNLLLNPHQNQRALLEQSLVHLREDAFQLCHHTLTPFFHQLILPLNFLNPNKPHDLSHFDDLTFWQKQLIPLLITQKGTWRKTFSVKQGFPPANELKGEMKNQIQNMKSDLLDTISGMSQCLDSSQLLALIELPDPSYSSIQWQVLSDLIELLPISVAQLQTVFRRNSCVDFNEINLRALTALGKIDQPSDIALAYDHKIQHILVDEFQDTSLLQHQLLLTLTQGWQIDDGRTLFFVGDPMQSIYRFRQAEVGLFMFVQQYGLGEIPLTSLTLTDNFRSSKTVMSWINQHVSLFFPKTIDINSGSVPYSPAEATQQKSTLGCHLKNTSHQVEEISALIQHLHQQYPQDHIAVLARSRNHVAKLCQSLSATGLDFEAVDIDPLHSRPVIRDLLALTKALLCACDRIAWFSLLRSPMCGLLLSDLLAISEALPGQSCWPLPSPKTLSQDSQQRLHYVIQVIKQAQATRYKIPLFAWINMVFNQLNGPICYADLQSQQEIQAFGQLMADFNWHELGSFEPLERQLSQLFASNTASHPIKIMTIHKAKGLEFDHVILPALEKSSPYDPHQLLHWLQRLRPGYPTDLILAPIDATDEDTSNLYQYVRKQEQLKQHHENMRLFYVAATRAKQSLHGFATIRTDQCVSKNALGYFLKDHFNPLPIAPQSDLRFDHDRASKQGISRLPISFFDLRKIPDTERVFREIT